MLCVSESSARQSYPTILDRLFSFFLGDKYIVRLHVEMSQSKSPPLYNTVELHNALSLKYRNTH